MKLGSKDIHKFQVICYPSMQIEIEKTSIFDSRKKLVLISAHCENLTNFFHFSGSAIYKSGNEFWKSWVGKFQYFIQIRANMDYLGVEFKKRYLVSAFEAKKFNFRLQLHGFLRLYFFGKKGFRKSWITFAFFHLLLWNQL